MAAGTVDAPYGGTDDAAYPPPRSGKEPIACTD
jgi:hypothetical protein